MGLPSLFQANKLTEGGMDVTPLPPSTEALHQRQKVGVDLFNDLFTGLALFQSRWNIVNLLHLVLVAPFSLAILRLDTVSVTLSEVFDYHHKVALDGCIIKLFHCFRLD